MSGTLRDDLPNPTPPHRAGGFDWLLWWRIDPDKLEEQVAGYKTLRPWQTMRGVAVLCLLLSSAITVAMIFLATANIGPDAFVDVGLMLVLAIFIYFGRRWAMIGAMILWSLEKILALAGGGIGVVTQVLWWTAYMHAFYFAFQIERQRRRRPATDSDVFA